MEPCPRLLQLQLDDRSRAGIERLRDIEQLGDLLMLGLGLNPLLDIFSKPFEASYDIATYDWGMWSAALSAVPEIVRERVRQEAQLQIIDHLHDPKQQRFWHAIEAGCRRPPLQPAAGFSDAGSLGSGASRDGVEQAGHRARRSYSVL